jgi:hypothetical protein
LGMDNSRGIGRELADTEKRPSRPRFVLAWKIAFFDALHSSCNLGLWVCVGPKGLPNIGSDAFGSQVLFPQIEDDQPLSRFVDVLL